MNGPPVELPSDEAPPPDTAPRSGYRVSTLVTHVAIVIALAACIGCDRVTKHVAATTLAGEAGRSFLNDTVRLQYVENRGGFLGLGSDLPPAVRTWVFTVGVGLMLFCVGVAAVRMELTRLQRFGLLLFVAGGASNWIDRVLHGSVIDFLNIGLGPLRTGIFNVADIAITVGAIVVVLAELRPLARPADTPADDVSAA